MSKRYDYKVEVGLKHNELPARVNIETGEFEAVTMRSSNIPDERIKWSNGNFKQPSKFGLQWAYDNLSDTQLRMFLKMVEMSGKDNTLKPLNDDISITNLMNIFKLSKNTIKNNIDILFKKGVYGRFEVSTIHNELETYWILNPFLSVSQGTVLKEVFNLFKNTEPAIYCKIKTNPNNIL